MATPFLDDFTDADATNLEDHTPSGGTAWTLVSGVAAAGILSSGALRSRTTTVSHYHCDDQGSADQYVQAKLAQFSLTLANSYICCRLADASNFVGWRFFGTGSAGLRLCEAVGGTVVDKYSFQGASGVVYRVETESTTARIYADGVQKGTGQTVNSSTETRQGVRIASDASTGWIDDFEAGSLGSSAPTLTSVSNDLADSYVLRADIASDLADAYALRSDVGGDITDAYAVRSSVAADLDDAYLLRANVSSDLGDAYVIDSATSVGSSLEDSYTIRTAVSGDLGDGYSVRANVSGDLEDAYLLRAGVAAEFVDLYSLRVFVSSDLADAYLSAGVVSSDFADSYAIQSEIAPTVLSAARRTYSNTQSAQRSNTQSARRPR